MKSTTNNLILTYIPYDKKTFCELEEHWAEETSTESYGKPKALFII